MGVGFVTKANHDIKRNDLKRLIRYLEPFYFKLGDQEKFNEGLLRIFIRNNISFKSILEVFAGIGGAPNLVHSLYNDPKWLKKKHSVTALLASLWGVDTAKRIEEVVETIISDPYQGCVVAKTGSDTSIINDTRGKRVVQLRENIRNGRDYSVESVVLEVCLTGLTVFDSSLVCEPKRFTATFKPSAYKDEIVIGPALVDEIIGYLIESGLVVANRLVKDALPALFNQYIESGLAELRDGVEYPGFYRKPDGSLSVIDYDLPSVSAEDLGNALIFLEELADFFPEQKVKLAHVLKWGLMAPFNFLLKQSGKWMPWLLLHGKAGSGKTTIAEIVLYLWGEPLVGVNDLGGSSFNSEARMGEKLRGSTFPLVVNEPGGVFEKPGLVELLKTAVESTTSRGRFEGRSYKTVLALAPVIFTSNHVPPSDDALIRRLDVISFSYAERKDEEEKKEFQKCFQVGDKLDCCFNELKPLAQFIARIVVDKPGLLDENWKTLINRLLKHAYHQTGRLKPLWLSGWSGTESLEELDTLLVERLRVFLQKSINRAYTQSKPGFNLDDVDNRVTTILEGRLVPWLFLGKNNKVYFSSGLVDALKKDTNIDESLKSIAELLGWNYQSSTVRGGFKGWCIVVDLVEFTDFIFP